MPPDAASREPVEAFAASVRHHLAEVNRRFLNLATGFDAIESRMVEAISNHLDAIGLEDLNPTTPGQQPVKPNRTEQCTS